MNWRATYPWWVGISVSPCPDAARIGYDERQINRIVIRLAQYFLDRNMHVIFGHDWREDGVMRAVADFAEVVAAGEGAVEESSDGNHLWNKEDRVIPRMLNVVPAGRESLTRTAIGARRDSGGILDVISSRDETGRLFELLPVRKKAKNLCDELRGRFGRAAELTAFRNCITQLLNPGCRICMGGKTSGYGGSIPGVMEEAMLALRFGKPLYLMGGFGGATRMFGEYREYWITENGLDEKQKEELFETTDLEHALRLIFTGIQAQGDGARLTAD